MSTSYNRIRLICALAALLLGPSFLTAGPPKQGDEFPDLATCGLEGDLPDLKGKVVLIDFFASWCGPCADSFPAMEELHKKYSDKGLVIVAINVDKKKEAMEKFLKRHSVSFSVVRDAGHKLVSQVKIPTMPSSFLVDRSGKVHSLHRGFKGDGTCEKYVAEIEALLN